MARLLTIAAGFLTLGSACALYGLNYDTRRLEARVQAQERAVEKAESDIAVLKSERAYLGRPERIEALARAQGLRPIRETQYITLGDLTDPPRSPLPMAAPTMSRRPAAVDR